MATTVVRISPSDFAERRAERSAGEIRLRADLLTAHRAGLQREVEELLEQYQKVSQLFEECSDTRRQLQQIADAAASEPASVCAAVKKETSERLSRLTDEADKCYAALRNLQASQTLVPQRMKRLERLLAANAPSSTRIARLPIVTEYEEIE